MRTSPKPRDERGDTLIEIIIAVILMGLVVGALFSSYTTASQASSAGKNVITADGVLRNAAEATKNAVRSQCTSGGTFTVSFTTPAGFSVPTVSQACPPTTGAPLLQVAQIKLVVSAPNGAQKSLWVGVRTP